jgi:hypothetical protein
MQKNPSWDWQLSASQEVPHISWTWCSVIWIWCSELWCHIAGQVAPHISVGHSSFIYKGWEIQEKFFFLTLKDQEQLMQQCSITSQQISINYITMKTSTLAHYNVHMIPPLAPSTSWLVQNQLQHKLTFKNCVLYIEQAYRYPSYPSEVAFYIFFSTTISTEYFKHAAHSPFFSSKCHLFHNATFLVPVLFTFYIQAMLKFKFKI